MNLPRRIRAMMIIGTILAAFLFASCATAPNAAESLTLNVAPGNGAHFRDIVYEGNDGKLYTVDAEGNAPPVPLVAVSNVFRPTTLEFSLPLWSPDGNQVAFVVRSQAEGEGVHDTIYVAREGRDKIVSLFDSTQSRTIYLQWVPGQQIISFLSASGGAGDLVLSTVRTDTAAVTPIVRGNPLYYHWGPGGSRLAVHADGPAVGTEAASGQIAVGERRGGKMQFQEIDPLPTFFRAPAFSPDGTMFAAATVGPGGNNTLALVSSSGKYLRSLAALSGFASFGWSAGGNYVAVLEQSNAGSSGISSGTLRVVKARVSGLQVALHEADGEALSKNAVAFFWSPAQDRLAYLEPVLVRGSGEQKGKVGLKLSVWTPHDGIITEVGPFPPAPLFVSRVLPYFDQYDRSASIWDPAGNRLVVNALTEDGSPGIYVVDLTHTPARVQIIAAGSVPFWKPAAARR